MKTLFLMLAFCGVVGATPSQPNLPQNPYSEDADYWAFRACDVLIHSDHVLRCKILYKEVQHTSAPIYSIHTYYAEVLECPKGCMIGKGCVISYSQQMEDSQAVPEGRHDAAGDVYLAFDSQEVKFAEDKKIWVIGTDFSFRAMGALYDYGKAMRRVQREHPELADKPESSSAAEQKLYPFIVELSKRNLHDEPDYIKLCIKRLLVLLPLIEQGQSADVVIPESKGNTALHYACAMGDLALVKCLLELGASPHARTDKGVTPLQCAGGKDALRIQSLLKEYGATR